MPSAGLQAAAGPLSRGSGEVVLRHASIGHGQATARLVQRSVVGSDSRRMVTLSRSCSILVFESCLRFSLRTYHSWNGRWRS